MVGSVGSDVIVQISDEAIFIKVLIRRRGLAARGGEIREDILFTRGCGV